MPVILPVITEMSSVSSLGQSHKLNKHFIFQIDSFEFSSKETIKYNWTVPKYDPICAACSWVNNFFDITYWFYLFVSKNIQYIASSVTKPLEHKIFSMKSEKPSCTDFITSCFTPNRFSKILNPPKRCRHSVFLDIYWQKFVILHQMNLFL